MKYFHLEIPPDPPAPFAGLEKVEVILLTKKARYLCSTFFAPVPYLPPPLSEKSSSRSEPRISYSALVILFFNGPPYAPLFLFISSILKSPYRLGVASLPCLSLSYIRDPQYICLPAGQPCYEIALHGILRVRLSPLPLLLASELLIFQC